MRQKRVKQIQRTLPASYTSTSRYKERSECNNFMLSAEATPATNNNNSHQLLRIRFSAYEAGAAADRNRNRHQRDQDVIHLHDQHQIERSEQRAGGATEGRDEIQLARVAAGARTVRHDQTHG